MSRKAMQVALEALESDPISHAGLVSRKQAITALRKALEEKQEPVAWRFRSGTWFNREVQWRYIDTLDGAEGLRGLQPLYTAPPKAAEWFDCTDAQLIDEVRRRGFVIRDAQIDPVKREWVGLTDEDMEALFLNEDGVRFARYIEAKLKEKNQ